MKGKLLWGLKETKSHLRQYGKIWERAMRWWVSHIFYQGNEPKVHFHGAFGKKDMVKVGCLRENSSTFLVLEAVIIELSGINAVREFDPALGLTLLKL